VNLILYGISNCDQVKKARNWLVEHKIETHFHDFKKVGVTAELIQSWLKQCDWPTLINRKGATWRKLSEQEQASVQDSQSAIQCMMQYPSVIKRPVLVLQHQQHSEILVGFSEPTYQQLFRTYPISS
jgi:arsenate reductase